MHSPLMSLLRGFSWQEWLHHPWRNAAAVVSIMLGVALAFSVHTINASALAEFSQAMRSVNGQADLDIRPRGANNDASTWGVEVLATLHQDPEVHLAVPVVEFTTLAHDAADPARRASLKVVGIDLLQAAALTPDLLPRTGPASQRWDMLTPGVVFLNPSAQAALPNGSLLLQQGMRMVPVRVAGSVRAPGPALAVMDIASAQELINQPTLISRIDVQLNPGVSRAAWTQRFRQHGPWGPLVDIQEPAAAEQRVGNLSQAYRVNLTVLALVALFTGSFLVYSVQALSVSRRAQQLALLAVLGLTAAQRLRLVLLESTVLGTVGSVLGIGLGTGLSYLALTVLGGDLGGGYFAGVAPALQWSLPAALLYAGLGLGSAWLGAWWPARQASQLPPVHTLKGLGHEARPATPPWSGLGLLVTGGVLALLPPIGGIALAAYCSVALLLLGGIATLPWLLRWLLMQVPASLRKYPVALLALERAHHVRDSAAVAVSGVVASLSLAVALTVMVASFRTSVNQWLDTVLPAELYVRSATQLANSQSAYFTPEFVRAAASLPGVQRLAPQRIRAMQWAADKPAVTLLARVLRQRSNDAGKVSTQDLPLVADPLPVPSGQLGVYVSEAVVDVYGVHPGDTLPQLEPWVFANAADRRPVFVAGVWRDYARQFGTVAMDLADYQRHSGDLKINDIAFWLTPQAKVADVQAALRTLADQAPHANQAVAGAHLEFGTATQIRANTLVIFDRSFAVTYWLQAVAIGIGLFGIAASFSAQVLARRREFGLLTHLGLTRRQILGIVALEGTTWTALGTLAGWGLGLAVAAVLVHVVNPQSFHWSMDLTVPWSRLLGMGVAVIAAGTLTAWISARSAASRDAVLAVKEDW